MADDAVRAALRLWQTDRGAPGQEAHLSAAQLYQLALPGALAGADEAGLAHLSRCPACQRQWTQWLDTLEICGLEEGAEAALVPGHRCRSTVEFEVRPEAGLQGGAVMAAGAPRVLRSCQREGSDLGVVGAETAAPNTPVLAPLKVGDPAPRCPLLAPSDPGHRASVSALRRSAAADTKGSGPYGHAAEPRFMVGATGLEPVTSCV